MADRVKNDPNAPATPSDYAKSFWDGLGTFSNEEVKAQIKLLCVKEFQKYFVFYIIVCCMILILQKQHKYQNILGQEQLDVLLLIRRDI